MIALDNGDKIRGVASVVGVVDYTLHGLVGVVATQLADGQLPIAIGDLYTAGSGGIAVTSIVLVNTDTAARTVDLYLTPSGGTARRLIPKNLSLGTGYMLVFDGQKMQVFDANGSLQQGNGVDYILHSLATAANDFLVASGAGVFIKKTLAEVKTILGLGTAAYTAAADYVTHALATAANDFLIASGSGTFVKKTLAEVKTLLNWAADIATHAGLTTGIHGVGAGTVAKIGDIAVDSNLSAAGQDAISKKHTQGTDTALGAVGTKATPVNADKVMQRNSTASDVLVTSTWTQIKAFLKTYFDTLYSNLAHKTRHQSGGADEISVAGLSGLLAADQHVLDTEVVTAVKTGNYVARTYVWVISGVVAIGTERLPTYRMKRVTTVEDIELHVKTAPTGAALIVDINEAGTTIFSTKPEIDAGGTVEDDNHVISDNSIAIGAELTMDIDQVGSTIAGSDLTVLLHCKELVI